MTTITLDNPKIEESYTAYEIKMKFVEFLEKDLKQDNIDLYEISVDDLPKKSIERLEQIDKLNFVNY